MSSWILFELDNGGWALPLEEVAEVAHPGSLRRIPGATAPVLGLAECRGRLITVLDLAGMLGGVAGAGPPAVVRLAGEREDCALYLTAGLRLGTAEPGPGDDPVVVDGRAYRRVGTLSLLEELAALTS